MCHISNSRYSLLKYEMIFTFKTEILPLYASLQFPSPIVKPSVNFQVTDQCYFLSAFPCGFPSFSTTYFNQLYPLQIYAELFFFA